MKITMAVSPDADDLFMVRGLLEKRIDTGRYAFEIGQLADRRAESPGQRGRRARRARDQRRALPEDRRPLPAPAARRLDGRRLRPDRGLDHAGVARGSARAEAAHPRRDHHRLAGAAAAARPRPGARRGRDPDRAARAGVRGDRVAGGRVRAPDPRGPAHLGQAGPAEDHRPRRGLGGDQQRPAAAARSERDPARPRSRT